MATKKRSTEQRGEAAVKSVVAGLQERYAKRGGSGLIMLASDMETPGSISTGCLALDLIMGGGVYYGRPVELFGEHSTGKSLVLMQTLREAQRAGVQVILADIEGAYDREYGAALGMDNGRLHLTQAVTVELVGDLLIDYIRDFRARDLETPLMVGVDSLAAAQTEHALEEPMAVVDMGKAKLLYRMLGKLRATFHLGPTALMWLNQARDRIQTGWVPPGMAAAQKGRGKAATSGGRGPGFEAHARVELTRLSAIHEGAVPKRGEADTRVAVGEFVGAFAEKTRMCKPFGHCVLRHDFGSGLDRWFGLWEAMIRTGRLAPKGGEAYEIRFGKGELLEFDRKDFQDLVAERPEVLRG